MGYGTFASSVFGGEGSPAVDPPAGQSLARKPGGQWGQDTGDNGVDFIASASPTPGAPNATGCLAGELFCEGECIDPLTSDTWCGAEACVANPCDGGSACVAGLCEVAG